MSQSLNHSEGDQCLDSCHERGGFVKATTKNDGVDDQRFLEYDKVVGHNTDGLVTEQQKQRNLILIETITKEGMLQEHPKTDHKINVSHIASHSEIRPLVSKYSLNRYSFDTWRKHNEKMLDCSAIFDSNVLNYNAQAAINLGIGKMDEAQFTDNNLLKQNARDLYRWKVEDELACKEITKEVELLEVERQRVRGACRALLLPEAITKECIELRSNRAEKDLVADSSDQELKREMELINEVRETWKSTLDKIDEQLAIDKAAKHRIEFEWCDKTIAYNNEAENLSLNTNSNTLMFRPGAVKFSEGTAPAAYWEYFCRDAIKNAETVRQNSEDLRSTLTAVLVNNGRNLRRQADRTDKAFAETIALTSELVTKLEERLRCILQSLADIESLIQNLQECIRKSDTAMKLAQTRLNNRNLGRPHGENVRDPPHVGLLHEVKVIHETATSLLIQLNNAEKMRMNLVTKRLESEKEIAAKRKSLNIDRERCGLVRSHYPTASELSGL